MTRCIFDEVRLCYIIIMINHLPRVGDTSLMFDTIYVFHIKIKETSLLNMRYIRIKESIVSRSQNDQKDSRAKERGRKKSIAFRNDSIIESREVVHGRRNSSIALSLKADTKEAVKERTE